MVKICPSIENNVFSYQTKICAKMVKAVGDEYKTQGYWSGSMLMQKMPGVLTLNQKKGKLTSNAVHYIKTFNFIYICHGNFDISQ